MLVYAKLDGKLAKWNVQTDDPAIAINSVKVQIKGLTSIPLAVIK